MMITSTKRSSKMVAGERVLDRASSRRAFGMGRFAEDKGWGFSMESILRWVLGPGLAMLLLMSLAVTGQGFPSEGWREGDGESSAKVPGLVFCQIAEMVHPGGGPPVLISIVRSERGFALGPENETLPLRLQVERVRGIDPSFVRRLLGENRTLGEIKAEIEGDGEDYSYRGNILIGHAHYLLEDLNLTSEGRNSTLAAELMEPVWGAIPTAPEPGHEIAGTVSIETRHLEDGSSIGVGTLLIFGGTHAGSYLVILDSSVGRGCGMESCPAFLGDLAGWETGLEAGYMRPQRSWPSFSAWRGPEIQDPFLEMILTSPALAAVPSSWGPGCLGCPWEADRHFSSPWDLRHGGPWTDFSEGDSWSEPRWRPKEMLVTRPAASEI
jgi:hypothetical protein